MSRKIRVALDATYAAYPERTGIGIYSEKLIAALGRILPAAARTEQEFILAFRPGPLLRWAWKRSWPKPFVKSPLLDSWLQFPRATLFHGLNQRLPEKIYPVEVVTIHDRFPPPSEDYSTAAFRDLMRRRIEAAVPRAARIITVSDAVRKQLLLYDPALDTKIRVVHLGVDPAQPATPEETKFFREHTLRLQRGERYFLNVGVVQTRKNILGIVQALKSLPGYRLVLTGGDGYGAEEIRAHIRRAGLQDRVQWLGYVDRNVIRLLYSGATALVFPSFEETFGLPILEAMSYGLPVITSNVSAMPEVAGDAAILVDPRRVSEISKAMRRIAEDEETARALRQKGLHRVRYFSWDVCAERTWAVYQEALREHV
ncbi:MAG: glycosyltransferase family 4 protein [Acidobacteria bacterium]|nr:glycosyltransferase family 4 protein [Acidobacteriota bacterium]